MNVKPGSQTNFAMKLDILRARLENELERPAVIALTASTADDGKDIAARGLAQSLAAAGYRTILIDSSSTGIIAGKATSSLSFEDLARQTNPELTSGSPSMMNLSDTQLQKTASQRTMTSALETLRSKFDYIVINAEVGLTTSFANTVALSADAVIVTVRIGRRETAGDARLSSVLDRIGDRFIGVIALDNAAIRESLGTVTEMGSSQSSRRNQAASPLVI